MTNPLLKNKALPAFTKIQPKYIKPALESYIQETTALLNRLLSKQEFSWDTLLQPLEENQTVLEALWSPVRHLNSVMNTQELRDAYEGCLPILTEFETKFHQNKQLLKAVKSLTAPEKYNKLTQPQRKIIDNMLRDFRLAGIALEEKEQEEFLELEKKLTQHMSTFGSNVLDATNHWYFHVKDEKEIAGLPDHAMQHIIEEAKKRKLPGYVFTLAPPLYTAVQQYADSRELRETLYKAYVTRASDQSVDNKVWDNTQLIEEIVLIRHQLALLLGFKNYAELSLATKMARTSEEVLSFLNSLAEKSTPVAKKEFDTLEAFAKKEYGIDKLEPWDVTYYSEKLKKQLHDFDPESLRDYFPENKVLSGLFNIVQQLFGITFQENKHVDKWHPDVRFFELYDQNHELRGEFYMDLYARPQKQGGAWVDCCHSRCHFSDGKTQQAVGFLVCNFNRPHGNKPALFSHDEVITLFHEFGHNIHQLLTKMDYPSIAGINGVPWDAVEFPSQLMENWCWEKETLQLISGHYQTNEPLPQKLFNNMLAAKNFQSGMKMVRQLEFALFDFKLHAEFDPKKGARAQEILDKVRQQVCVTPFWKSNRFQNSFTHIFDGGYGAGYYSYKWAEVLSSDAFSKFLENGILDKHTGKVFLHSILEKGGSKEPMDMFIEFMGREPDVDALLVQDGIIG